MERQNKASSFGEVSAITGYWKQYEYSSSVLFRLMQDGTLEAISVSEPSAGIFDDLVIHVQGRVLATQVKSARDATYVSLATEFKGLLIKAMAESWLGLQQRYDADAVRLRYIFPGFFSTSDTALANASTSGARHSAEFARFVSRDDLTSEMIETSIWRDALTDLQVRSGLDRASFVRFLCDLDLKDERELQASSIATFQPAEREKVEAIRSLLPILITTSSPGQRWSEQDLVEKLGWRSRLSQHNVHVFPVPSDYQENESTERKLVDLIRQTTQGYIALVGPPGTGKSTLLQRGLYSTPDYSVSRYLAFHPGQRHGLGRAEAGEFLNDLIAEFRSQGLYASKFAHDNLSGLRAEFAKQLDAASERFRKSGRKTLIVIDGLDHVPREENPVVSFLAELPASAAIPDGVVFVLGTQRIELRGLHATIVQQTREANRTIVIDPLTKAAVFALADAATVPSFVDRETLFERCSGHPLTARYFIEALKLVSDADEAEKILSDAEGLGQSLQQIYERVWQKLDTARSSRAALGLLARAESTLSSEQLSKGSNDEAVEDVLATAGFLLSRNVSGRLSIFHNSFRLFVAQETGRKFGQPSAEVETDFHARLATIAHDAPINDPQYWFQLRYRSRAGDFDGVRALGQPTYFRQSLKAFRPPGEIYSDLRLTYGAVRPTGDRTLLLNKLLIEKEVDYRLEAVSNLDVVDLLMGLGDVELATRHALEVGESSEGWLALVDYYWRNGEPERARQIFEANEPLEILFAGEGFDPYQMKRARGWIQRAQRFRPLEKLSALVDSIVVKTRAVADDDDDGSGTRRSLKFHLALGAIIDGRFTDLNALEQVLPLNVGEVACLAVQAAEVAYSSGRTDDAIVYLESATAANGLVKAHSSWRRAATSIALKVGKTDLARHIAATLAIPRLDRYGSTQDDMGDLSRAIIETAFLAAELHLEIVEEAQAELPEKSSLLANAHVRMREIGALQSLAKRQDPSITRQALRTIVLFFAQAKPDSGDFAAYRFFASLGSIAHRIIRIAKDAGEQCFADVIAFVDEMLNKSDNNLSRSDEFRLNFATAVFDVDRDSSIARTRLDATRSAARADRTPQQAVDSYAAIARAYGHVGEISEARVSLEAMHQDTFGYWLRAKKEPQYTFWAWSFLKACESSPATMEHAALIFAQFILGMDETEGDETAARLVADLLEGAGVCPRAAAGITARLLDSDLSTWAKISEAALASVAKHDSSLAPLVLIACSCLVVPFVNGGGIDRCLQACLPAMSPAARAHPIEVLVASIRRWCPPSEREVILRKIVELASETEAALQPLLTEVIDITEKLRRVIHGESGEKSPESGVSLDIEVESLSKLISHGDGKTGYGDRVDYSYARAAEKLAPTSSEVEIEDFVCQRPHIEADAKTMVAFARRFLAFGYRTQALEYFAKAETAALSGYWSTFMGGQKLAVQKLRIELQGKSAIDTGFDVLLSELTTGQTDGSSLFLNLDKVLELVADPIPFVEFWAETQAHLMQYREFRLAAPVCPVDAVGSHSDLLAFIVAQGFSLSCPELLQHARRAGEFIANSSTDSAFVEKLFHFLRELPDGRRESAALLQRLRKMPQLEAYLRRDSEIEATSDDFIVSNIAKRALRDFGEPYEEPPSKGLPAFYQLLPSGTEQADNFDPPPGLLSGQRPVWSGDPWTWTSMLRGPLKLLTDACDIPLELLRRRCASFMAKDGGRTAFGPEVEEAIVRKLRRLHLQFAYRRPMASSCLRAIGKVVQELDLAKAVDRNVLHVLWAEIGGPSLSDFLIEEEPRPNWLALPPMPHRKFGGIEAEQWLEQAETVVHSTLVPEAFVLAEETHFTVQAWRSSAEVIRIALPCPADLTSGVERLPRLFSFDYLRPMYKRSESKLVCRIPGDLFGNLENETMTICPYVASDLGWKRLAINPLELRDSSGELVAKTVRWVEGTQQKAQHGAELHGAGQIVLLTKSGKAQLEASGTKVVMGTKVTASVEGKSGEPHSREILAGG
ncbi:ATP-binding protein [Reyranella sp. CPCC 100927]|uniref:AAA family ATPase n=1 Tax=Reyranella sp. CPCC 100927 TaxID=2599616 RepID=UPI0011B3AE7D|nr:ATP-binding protein [Reyranella sp. CPCC 100927]TWT02929.1 ATP-binding protein [Reyranella sp. CPCC 100927]